MTREEINEIQKFELGDINSINELLMILNHYPSHTLAATIIILSRIILILNKDLNKDIDKLVINELIEDVDQNDLINLAYLFANNTLTQYKNNKENIDERFSFKYIN